VFGPLLFAGDVAGAIGAASELGFDGIEVSLRSADELDAGWLADELTRTDLELCAVGTGRMFLEEGLSLTDAERTVRELALRRLLELTTFAARFSAVVIVGLVRGARPTSADGSREFRSIAEAVTECADHAAGLGTRLVVEAINRYETRFQNTAHETLRLLDAVARPNVTVLLDVFHMNVEEVDMAEAVRAAGPRLGHLHIVDSNRHAPGLGHVDYEPIFAALRETDYRGWVSAEILPLPNDLAAARAALDFMRSRAG
jgi:sugar phosphate isomerase/epimerase